MRDWEGDGGRGEKGGGGGMREERRWGMRDRDGEGD